MGDKTGISWTDATWNPWHGCIKISPGCKLCYMYRDKARYGQAWIPFFLKQLGGHPNARAALSDMPEDLRIQQFPSHGKAE